MIRRNGLAGLAAASLVMAMVFGAGTAGAAGTAGTAETEETTEATEASGDQTVTADTAVAVGLHMSTDYPGITVKAGENVSFPLSFRCAAEDSCDASLSVASIPDGWSGFFKGGSSQITSIHVDGTEDVQDQADASFALTVPEDAKDGTYPIELQAENGNGDIDTLTLQVTISQEEAVQSTFTSQYPEQQGASGTTFTFDTTIVNNRGTEQSYSLLADVPAGWQAAFTPSGESTSVASLAVEADSSQSVTVTITPPENVEKGDYTIPCSATSADDTLSEELQVSITGTYAVTLSTPDGKLSLDAYADKESAVTLSITNTGNVNLDNLNLTSQAPTDWEVRFSESTIDTLEAGATKEVTAYIKPCQNVITGDYVTSIGLSNSETQASADFRVSVKTSTVWGFAAAGIIVVLICVLGVIFKKYGRR